MVFFIDRTGRFPSGVSEKKIDEAEEIANRNMGASVTLPSIFLADLSKVYRKTHECRVFLTVKVKRSPQDYINELTI